jgi:hypothetical protein
VGDRYTYAGTLQTVGEADPDHLATLRGELGASD